MVGLATFVYMLVTDPHTRVDLLREQLAVLHQHRDGLDHAGDRDHDRERALELVDPAHLGLGTAAYLPIAFILFLPMLLGLRGDYFPWIEEMATDPILQAKPAWLNVPFLVTRNLVGAIVLFGIALYFTYLQVRPDLGLAAGAAGDDAGRARWRERLTANWIGQEAEEVRSWKRMVTIAPVLVMVYAVVMSMFAFDWAMSLEPHWYSTLFGGWFFMGAFWGGIALTVDHQRVDLHAAPGLRAHCIGRQQRHDLGMLAFGVHGLLGVHVLVAVDRDLVREAALGAGLDDPARRRSRGGRCPPS